MHIVFILTFGLFYHVGQLSATVYRRTISGYGNVGYIKSTNFNRVQIATGDVYEYTLKNKRSGGTIVIYAVDFDLYPYSSFKVFDKNGKNTSISIWTGRDRPVYQSSGKELRLVYKEGKFESAQRYIGYNIKYKFTNGPRVVPSPFLPEVGSCPEMDLSVHGHFEFNGRSGKTPTFFSCVWVVNHTEPVTVNVTSARFGDGYTTDFLEVRDGDNSGSSLLISVKKSRSSSNLPKKATGKKLYIRLDIRLRITERLRFEYHTQKTKSKGKTRIVGFGCKYKKCGYRCVNYWESCKDEKDTSCDHDDAEYTCGNKCYLKSDVCDDINDCEGSPTGDEENCSCKDKQFTTKSKRNYIYYYQVKPRKSNWPHIFYLGTTSSSTKCREYCQRNKQCQVYTYFSSRSLSVWRRQCYGMIKNVTMRSRSTSYAYSGIVKCSEGGTSFLNYVGYTAAAVAVFFICFCHMKANKNRSVGRKLDECCRKVCSIPAAICSWCSEIPRRIERGLSRLRPSSSSNQRENTNTEVPTPVTTAPQRPAPRASGERDNTDSASVISERRVSFTDLHVHRSATETSLLDIPDSGRPAALPELDNRSEAPPYEIATNMPAPSPPAYDVAINLPRIREARSTDNIPPPPPYSLYTTESNA